MPDVTLWDIAAGVKTSWGNNPTLTALIPATRVHQGRAPQGATYPLCVFSFKDVSAYFGGTQYYSGSDYVKVTQFNFEVYGAQGTDGSAIAQAIADTFGWAEDREAGMIEIRNAVILSSMPEVEGGELTTERIDGIDYWKYSTSFTVRMQAERG